jgi:hypothetical protein
LPSGRRPEVRSSLNPAISGHYPARRLFAWLSQAFDRKPPSFKHIRRHQASQIGRVAIYPAMDCVPVNVRKCPQWAANRSYPNAETNPRIGVCDSLRRWPVRNCPQEQAVHSDWNEQRSSPRFTSP